MRAASILACCVLMSGSLASPARAGDDTECAHAQTQMAMNACASAAASTAHAKESAALAKLLRAEPSLATQIRASESAFLAYRAKACGVSMSFYAGGSIAPTILAQCEAALDAERARLLANQLPQDRQ